MHATSIDTHSTDTHPQHHSCLSTSNPSLPALRATNMHSTSVVHLPNLGTTHPSLSTPGAYFTSPPYTTFFNTFGHPSHAIYPRQKMLLWKFYRMAWTAHANADAPAPSWVVHPARITLLHPRLAQLTPVMVQALGKQKDPSTRFKGKTISCQPHQSFPSSDPPARGRPRPHANGCM